jgi:hypothetical protein
MARHEERCRGTGQPAEQADEFIQPAIELAQQRGVNQQIAAGSIAKVLDSPFEVGEADR